MTPFSEIMGAIFPNGRTSPILVTLLVEVTTYVNKNV
jgi:hypothetical protein